MEIATGSKTFTVAVLYTYIADRQDHNLQKKIHGEVKNHENHKVFPHGCFPIYDMLQVKNSGK